MKRWQKALAMSNFDVRVLLPKEIGRFAGNLAFFPVSSPRIIQNLLEGSFGFAWVIFRSHVLRREESSSRWISWLMALISGLVGSVSRIWSLVEDRAMASCDRFGMKLGTQPHGMWRFEASWRMARSIFSPLAHEPGSGIRANFSSTYSSKAAQSAFL